MFNRLQPVCVRGQPRVGAAGVQRSGGQRRDYRGSQILLHGLPRQRRSRAADQIRLCRSHEATFQNVCITVGASLVPFLSQELFVKLVPFHCLGCIWSQRDKKENRNLAPTVRATISQFNAVTNRVITSLLCPFAPGPLSSSPVPSPSSSSSTFPYPSADLNSPDSAHTSPAHRARIIERWISIAQVWNQNLEFQSFGLFLPPWNYMYFLLV